MTQNFFERESDCLKDLSGLVHFDSITRVILQFLRNKYLLTSTLTKQEHLILLYTTREYLRKWVRDSPSRNKSPPEPTWIPDFSPRRPTQHTQSLYHLHHHSPGGSQTKLKYLEQNIRTKLVNLNSRLNLQYTLSLYIYIYIYVCTFV